METFCFIIALQIVIGLYIIPFFSLTRVYYYFVPSFIYAYETDSIQEINGLNKTRFIVLITLLFLSFFIGINGTKYILTYDSTEFSIISGLIVELLVLIFLFLQFFICISIEKKIPNNLFSFFKENLVEFKKNIFNIYFILHIENNNNIIHNKQNELLQVKKNQYIVIQIKYKVVSPQIDITSYETIVSNNHTVNSNLIKNELLSKDYNLRIMKLSKLEVVEICNDFSEIFVDSSDITHLVNLIDNYFINENGQFIDLKIHLNANNLKKQNDKKKISKFLLKILVFENPKKKKSNGKHISFLNKYFTLNGDKRAFTSRDSKDYLLCKF